MKRLLLIIAAMGFFTYSNAQDMQIGPQAGVNLANLSGEGYDDANMRTGLNVGATVNIGISDMFSFRPGIFYSQKGAQFEQTVLGTTIESTQLLDYIHVPLTPQLNFGDDLKFFIKAGPYAGFNILAENQMDDDSQDISDDVNTLDFGIDAGAGIMIPAGEGSVLLDVNYGLGLAAVNSEGDDNITNSVIGISAGYLFSFD